MDAESPDPDLGTILNTPDDRTVDRLLPFFYEELRRMARFEMAGERADHTLDPTALANETYLRLAASHGVAEKGRAYLLGAAAKAMRRVLIDHARLRKRDKRGGQLQRISLTAANVPAQTVDGLLELNDALEKLAARAARQAIVVEARYFGGMSVKETAELRDVSERTIKGDWAFAKAWLGRLLTDSPKTGME